MRVTPKIKTETMSQAARCWCWLRQPLGATEGNRRVGKPMCTDIRMPLSAQEESARKVILWRSERSSSMWSRRGIVPLSEQKTEVAGRMLLDVFEEVRVNYLTSHYRQTQRLGRSPAHSPEHYLSWPKAHENHSERTRLSLPFNASFLKLYFNSMKSGLRNIIIKVFIRNI